MLEKINGSTTLASLGASIRKLREEKGRSLTSLAEDAKISKTYLWQLEHETSTPTIDVVRRIAHALDVSISELLGEDSPKLSYELQLPLPGSIFQILWNILHKLSNPEQQKAFAAKLLQFSKEIENDNIVIRNKNEYMIDITSNEHIISNIVVPILEYRVMQPSIISDIPKISFLFEDIGKQLISKTTSIVNQYPLNVTKHTSIEREIVKKLPRLLQQGGVENIINLLRNHFESLDVTARKGYYHLIEGLKEETDGEDNKAIASYETALSFFKHSIIIGFLNLSIGRIYAKYKYDQSIHRLQLALQFLDSYVDNPEKIILLTELGWLCYRASRARHEEAINYFNQAIDIIEREPNKSILILGAYRGLGAIYNTSGEFTSAVSYLEKGVQISKETGQIKEIAWDNYRLAVSIAAGNNWEEALQILEKAKTMAYDINDYEVLQQIYNQIGHIRKKQGQFDLALEFHYKACKLQELITANKAQVSQAFLDRHLGATYLEMKSYDRAVGCVLEATEKFAKMGVLYQQPWNYAMLAEAMAGISAYESAVHLARKALRLVQETPNKLQEGIVRRALGVTLRKAGNVEDARVTLLEAIKIFREIEDQYYLAKTLIALADIELDGNRYKQARKLFGEALNLFTQLGAEGDVAHIQQCFHQLDQSQL